MVPPRALSTHKSGIVKLVYLMHSLNTMPTPALNVSFGSCVDIP